MSPVAFIVLLFDNSANDLTPIWAKSPVQSRLRGLLGVLADWQRVLAPDCSLRLPVRNFAMSCKLYQSGVLPDKFPNSPSTLYGCIPDDKDPLCLSPHDLRRTVAERASLQTRI